MANNRMAEFQKRKLSKSETKKLMPVLRHFNGIAKVFIRMLTQQIELEEKRLGNVKHLVTGGKIPKQNYNINIHTVDINNTVVRKKGSFSYSQSMTWEEDLRKKKRGFIL